TAMRAPISRVDRFTVAYITLAMPTPATANVTKPIMPRKLCKPIRNCCILFCLRNISSTWTTCSSLTLAPCLRAITCLIVFAKASRSTSACGCTLMPPISPLT
ncbi:hypothetical protein D031_3695B, partial [Vibrio parahaemolyticus VP-48]